MGLASFLDATREYLKQHMSHRCRLANTGTLTSAGPNLLVYPVAPS